MNTKRFAHLILLLTGLLFTGGCHTVTPQATALKLLHETYTSEFTSSSVPGQGGAPALSGSSGSFTKSLQSIKAFQKDFPKAEQELAHVKVLEGMIYLQTGQFGMAQGVADEVKTASTKLSSATGFMVRDQLFARNFSTLITGWAETRKPNDKDWRTFERVANSLGADLKANSKKLPAAEADQGALYLATSAAIFYTWGYRQIRLSDDNAQAPAKKTEWFTSGRDLIGAGLTSAQKTAPVETTPDRVPAGILRYVQWYQWLNSSLSSP